MLFSISSFYFVFIFNLKTSIYLVYFNRALLANLPKIYLIITAYRDKEKPCLNFRIPISIAAIFSYKLPFTKVPEREGNSSP